jgi:hypothetical protein
VRSPSIAFGNEVTRNCAGAVHFRVICGVDSDSTKRYTMPLKKTEKATKTTVKFPRVTLEEAMKVPLAIKEKNGGNPWATEEVAKAVEMSRKTNPFFYLVAGARDYGLTTGSRDSERIELTPQGRDIVYAPDPQTELQKKREAFLRVEPFRKVLEHYKGSDLPEMKYLRNTLEREFKIEPEDHEEFSRLFRENCAYLGIQSGGSAAASNAKPGRRSWCDRRWFRAPCNRHPGGARERQGGTDCVHNHAVPGT